MSPGRLLLIGAVVVLCILFVAGVGLGFTQKSNKGLGEGWTNSLGQVLTQPAQPGDLSPKSPGCLQGDTLTVTTGSCSYDLKTGFLAKRLKLKVVSAGALGVQVQVTMTVNNNPVVQSKQLFIGDAAALNYQNQGSSLTVQCLTPITPCTLQLLSG